MRSSISGSLFSPDTHSISTASTVTVTPAATPSQQLKTLQVEAEKWREAHTKVASQMHTIKEENYRLSNALISLEKSTKTEQSRVENIEAEKESINTELRKAKQQLNQLAASNSAATTTSKIINKALSQALVGNWQSTREVAEHAEILDELKKQVMSRDKEVEDLRYLVKNLRSDLDERDDQLSGSMKDKAELEEELKDRKREVEHLMRLVDDLTIELRATQRDLRESREQCRQLEDQLAGRQDEVGGLRSTNRKMSEELENRNAEIRKLQEQVAGLSSDVMFLNDQVEGHSKASTDWEAALRELSRQLQLKERALEEMRGELTHQIHELAIQLSSKERTTEGEREDLISKLQQKERTLQGMHEELAMQSKSLASQLAAKEQALSELQVGLKQQLKAKEQALEELRAELRQAQGALDAAKQEAKVAIKSRDQTASELATAKHSIGDMQLQLTAAHDQALFAASRIAAVEKEVEDLLRTKQEGMSRMSTEVEALAVRLADTVQQRDRLDVENANIQKQLSEKAALVASLNEEVRSTRAQLQQAQAQERNTRQRGEAVAREVETLRNLSDSFSAKLEAEKQASTALQESLEIKGELVEKLTAERDELASKQAVGGGQMQRAVKRVSRGVQHRPGADGDDPTVALERRTAQLESMRKQYDEVQDQMSEMDKEMRLLQEQVKVNASLRAQLEHMSLLLQYHQQQQEQADIYEEEIASLSGLSTSTMLRRRNKKGFGPLRALKFLIRSVVVHGTVAAAAIGLSQTERGQRVVGQCRSALGKCANTILARKRKPVSQEALELQHEVRFDAHELALTPNP